MSTRTDAVRFHDIAATFDERTRRIVWCSVATVNRDGRPRTRILHPIWEGEVGWIATGRWSAKAEDIENNPYVSLSYWDQKQEQVHVDARAEWEEDLEEKARIWKYFDTLEPPVGYDLAAFFGSVDDPDFGLLRIRPWRIELYSLEDVFKRRAPTVWTAEDVRVA